MAVQNTTSEFTIPPEIDAEMTPAVRSFVAQLFGRIQQLEQEVQKLTPQNSSLPPSTQHPHARPKSKSGDTKNKRKQGGQKGHKKQTRALIPTEECKTVVPCLPEACRRCGGELEAVLQEPIRHQVWDLPPIEPEVTEYQLHRGRCRCCGITTCGALPEGVPSGQCGPRLAAFTGLLMGHFRQSKRRASLFLEDLLNIPCSAAWTVKIQGLVSEAIAAPYEQLRQELSKQKQLFVDESPGPMLTRTSPGFPYASRNGAILSALRITEQRLRVVGLRPHSAFKLFTAGSVGSQALTGIPVVHRLRFHPLLSEFSLVWPFEAGLDAMLANGKRPLVVHAEIWPGVVQQAADALRAIDPTLFNDQAQVRAMCLWAEAKDTAGALAPFFSPPNLSVAEQERCISEEGWILGSG